MGFDDDLAKTMSIGCILYAVVWIISNIKLSVISVTLHGPFCASSTINFFGGKKWEMTPYPHVVRQGRST